MSNPYLHLGNRFKSQRVLEMQSSLKRKVSAFRKMGIAYLLQRTKRIACATAQHHRAEMIRVETKNLRCLAGRE